MTTRYRLRAAEQRAVHAAMTQAAPKAAEAFEVLAKLDAEIRASVPPEAQGEASRAWMTYVLRRMSSEVEPAFF
jgi:hypothetical protein